MVHRIDDGGSGRGRVLEVRTRSHTTHQFVGGVEKHDDLGVVGAPTLRDEPNYRNGTVLRYGMIGKAFFVYWPGGFRPPVPKFLPIVPNVGRMRLIR